MPIHKDRIINGRAVPTREFTELLIKGLAAQPDDMDSSAVWLSKFIGDPEWDCVEARQAIAKKLLAMAGGKKAVIERGEARGRYVVKKAFARRGLSGEHQLERLILDFLKENGGLARRKDVMAHLLAESAGDRVNIDKTIARSAKIRKDYNVADRASVDTIPENRPAPQSNTVGRHVAETTGRNRRHRLARETGFINLHPHQIHALILQGRWVQRLVRMGFWAQPSLVGEVNTMEATAAADDFLRGIGRLAAMLREHNDLTLDDLVERPAMKAALDAAIKRYTAKNDIALLREVGFNPHEARIALYVRFEGGEGEGGVDLFRYRAHGVMRNDFYEAWAGLYNLDPVALSRGLIMADVLDGADDLDWEALAADEDDTTDDDPASPGEMQDPDFQRIMDGLADVLSGDTTEAGQPQDP